MGQKRCHCLGFLHIPPAGKVHILYSTNDTHLRVSMTMEDRAKVYQLKHILIIPYILNVWRQRLFFLSIKTTDK
jgi:hypothetical protein